MDSKAQLTVDIIALGEIDIVNATKVLNKSRRTIERYLNRYRQAGIQFIVYRNTGKSKTFGPFCANSNDCTGYQKLDFTKLR